MIEQIITSIVCIILAVIIGYSIGNTDYHKLEKRNFKLEIQNKILKREYYKLHDIIEYFKDERNELLVNDKHIVIYIPKEDDESIITELGLWAND